QTWPGKKVETELHYAGKKLLLSLTLAVLICSLIFLETAHGYGYKINTVENTAFRSSFTAEELAKLNEDYADKKESSAISSFVNEAERHLFQRNLYASKAFPARNGKVYYEHGKSLKENIILEKHYMAYLKERGALWNDSMRTHITKKGAWLLSKPWTSRVKETMFTDTNKWAVRIIFAAAILLLPLPFVGLKRS
ncbi:MAG: hypothetical protein JNL74_10040, partial [Fibrobacteres bacterium]|nr:hypothetical protein [Fibrobacterota bacterium]